MQAIGGDFGIEWTSLCDGSNATTLFASGRDAFAAILRDRPTKGEIWLIPDFMCPVIPAVVERCEMQVRPYRWLTPWLPDLTELERVVASAAGIVVPVYMGLPPANDLWQTLERHSLCVVEDRCQTVGPPPSPKELCGDYAIGSFRKWVPTPDGAYCVARTGQPPAPTGGVNHGLVEARLAAALTKQARQLGLDSELDSVVERTYLELFRLGERLADYTDEVRRASPIAELLIQSLDYESIAQRRVRNQQWLACRLEDRQEVRILEPQSGMITHLRTPLLALPVLCEERDQLRGRLATSRIFCAIHWVDGNWTGRSAEAAYLAAHVLSIPVDQRYDPDDLQSIVEVLS